MKANLQRNKHNLLVLAALLTMFLSTMPGHGMVELALSELDLYATNQPILVEYSGSLAFSLIAISIWFLCYGVFAVRIWNLSRSKYFRCRALVSIGVLLLGKVLDLTFEGVLYSGNYFAVLSASIMVLRCDSACNNDIAKST